MDSIPTEDLEDLYENAPCGYLSIRPNGRIFKANTTLATWIGSTTDQLIGKRLQDFLTIGTRIFYETNVAPLLPLYGEYNEIALELRLTNGNKLPVFANAIVRPADKDRVSFTRVTLFKASERWRYERELIEARKEADIARAESQNLHAAAQELLRLERENSILREQFIAVLGHDLRNPLASIIGGMRLLLREPQSERSQQIIVLLQSSGQRMAGLIDNVMDFARGKLGGGFVLSRNANAPLTPVLEQVVSELRIHSPERKIMTEFAIDEPIDCDRARIGQMVSNLLGNALTHGDDQQPVRIVAATRDDTLELSVANNGKPIPKSAMKNLFQPFFRAEVRSSLQGLGLGLHIASEIAKAHGGTLTAESSTKETCFTFRMPLQSS